MFALFKFFLQLEMAARSQKITAQESWHIYQPNLNPAGYGYLQAKTVWFVFFSPRIS